MRYPYQIRTRLGWTYPHTNEANVDISLPPGTLISLHDPLPETRSTGRALIVRPVASSDHIKTLRGEIIPIEDLRPYIGRVMQHTPEGVPIVLGEPITEAEIDPAHHKVPVILDLPGHSPIPVPIIAIVILIIAICAAIASIAVYYTVREQEITKRHAMDLGLQMQEITNVEYLDVDGDGVDDVERRTYRNGDIIDVALNETGSSWLGGTAKVQREGVTYDDLLKVLEEEQWWEKLIVWGIIAAVAVGAVVIAVKVIPPLLKKKGGE